MSNYLPAFCLLCAFSSQATAQSFVTLHDGDAYFSDTGLDNLMIRHGDLPQRHSLADTAELGGTLSAILQFDLLNVAPIQNGVQFGHQVQMGLSGSWGTLTLGRETDAFNADPLGGDLLSADSRTSSKALAGLTIPEANHTVFATYRDQTLPVDTNNDGVLRRSSLSYTYSLSRLTSLFIARTRIDNPNPMALPGFAGFGCKQLQLGIQHVF